MALHGLRRLNFLHFQQVLRIQRAQRSASGHWRPHAGILVIQRFGPRLATPVQVALSSACCARPNAPPA
jgi:hypothetical protein